MPISTLTLAAIFIEYLLIAAGGVLLWRQFLSPAARGKRFAPKLGPWPVRGVDFALFLWLAVLGAILGAGLARFATPHLSGQEWMAIDRDTRTLLAGFGSQLGMLASCLWLRTLAPAPKTGEGMIPGSLASGAATFLMIMPVMAAVGLGWKAILESFGVEAKSQSLVDMIAATESGLLLSAVIVFAVVVAPVTEEFIFRAGLFRYLRTRVPRPLAFLIPALVFAALHVNWTTLDGITVFAPLVALGVIFSMAYERTGSIAVAMVAHGLFNLNTILVILAGVEV